MIEKFDKNAKVEKFTNMLGKAVRLIVIDPSTQLQDICPGEKDQTFFHKTNLTWHLGS